MWTNNFYYNHLCPADLSIVVITYFEDKASAIARPAKLAMTISAVAIEIVA